MVFGPLTSTFRNDTKAEEPPTPEVSYIVLAAGERASVFNPTTFNNTTNHNGTEWYYRTDASIGFASSGSVVQLNTADVYDQEDPLRLSWHTSGGNLNDGWRAGATTGMYSGTRYIYEAATLPSYYPEGPQSFVNDPDLTGWSLCFTNDYGDYGIALSSILSACDETYIMYAASDVIENKVDVEFDGSSILDTPGGTQESLPRIYPGDKLTTLLYETDGTTLMEWSDFRVYISTCSVSECETPSSPLISPSDWDEGTWITTGTYTIPEGADSMYLAIFAADDETGTAVNGNYVTLNVTHIPVERTVSTCEELQNLSEGMLADNITQTADIDCSATHEWNYIGPTADEDYAGFIPLGDTDYRFTGHYDGQGHTISNLYINSYDDYVGLFSVIDEGAVVENLGLVDVTVYGEDQVGALAGALSGTVENVYSTGNVYGDDYVGGLVGIHIEPMGSGSSSPLVFTWNGTEYEYVADVGRSLPRNTDGIDYTQIDSDQLVPSDDKYSVKISEEYNEIVYYDELELMTFDHEPGIRVLTSIDKSLDGQFFTVDENPSNPLLSCTDMYGNNCLESLQSSDDSWSYKHSSNLNYWTMDFGDLSGAERILLIVEGARDYSLEGDSLRYVKVKDESGNWIDAYSKSDISAPSGSPLTNVLDLTGKFPTDNYEVQVAFDRARLNYFAIDTSTQQPYEMNSSHPTSVDLNFRGYTAIDKTYYWNHDYETVSETPDEVFATQVGRFTKYGDVTPLLQETDDQPVVMHHGDHMDIEFDYEAPASPETERSYILYSWATYKHAETAEGRTVEPLPFNGMSEYPYSAPESYPLTQENIDYLREWNTRVYTGPTEGSSTILYSYSEADVDGWEEVGGLVGYNEKYIEGSYATGNVYVYDAEYSLAGGFVGYNSGEIYASYATGNVLGDEYSERLGGFAGGNDEDIYECFATGNVSGGEKIGGFTAGNGGYIWDSYARGSVTGYDDVGGFTGRLGGDIYDSYATGAVNDAGEGYSDDFGGFIGYYSGDVEYSFYDYETTGMEYGCGEDDCDVDYEVLPRTTAEMKLEETFTTELGEDSWDFFDVWDINPAINDGYPYLMATIDDDDGVKNSTENNAPNDGDANDDGILDSQQPNVASFINSVNEEYTSLEMPETCSIQSVEVFAESETSVQDAGYDYLSGIVSFTADCGTPGFTAEVSFYFFGVDPAGLVLRKYNPNTFGYTPVEGTTLEQVTIGGELATKVTYQVTDGGVYDIDETENGTIVDPVGLASSVLGVPDTGFAKQK